MKKLTIVHRFGSDDFYSYSEADLEKHAIAYIAENLHEISDGEARVEICRDAIDGNWEKAMSVYAAETGESFDIDTVQSERARPNMDAFKECIAEYEESLEDGEEENK